MPDWDKDSPLLRQNLARVLEQIVRTSQARESPTLKAVKYWHALVMQGLDVPDARFVGAFRGEPGLENSKHESARTTAWTLRKLPAS